MKKILYLDNNNNFYLNLKLAKASKHRWMFVVFDKSKKQILEKEKLETSCYQCNVPSYGNRNTGQLNITNHDIRSAIKNDRILKRLPFFLAKRIALSHVNFVLDSVDIFKPDLVIGEVSWANEYLVYKELCHRGVKYRHLLNLPLDENYIVSFDSEHSFSSLKEAEGLSGERYGERINYYDLCEGVKKRYSKLGNIKLVTKRLFDFSSQINDYRINQIYWKTRLVIKYIYIIFDQAFNKLCKNIDYIQSTDKKIIYFSLHIQPEATPDFVSMKFSDQLNLASQIASRLATDEILIIKDHPNSISIRNIYKLLALYLKPNVIFIRRKASASELINLSSLVCSVAGTVSLESIKKSKPAIVFSNIFYNQSKFISSITEINDFVKEKEFLLSLKCVHDDLSNNICCYGVKGFIHDPSIFPDVLLEKNINAINELINAIIEK
ncbi:hypothetical protein ACTL6P_04495 [Endozoicomonas acroporae]|uniref:hypothetical protein n=1 Tax=Endozoicomonas acroporae TaxID=1701104 RepID=UPI0011AF603F|nr:hypothetical protein [Endozoicomonas acroporae]